MLKTKKNMLDIARQELGLEYPEKKSTAEELIIANKELVFQNKEREKRAAELVIANTELAFQNIEKENRATELVIVNNELLYQNKEKERRAAELIIANKELAFQNIEKENRAAELVIANTELAFQNDEKEKRALEKFRLITKLQRNLQVRKLVELQLLRVVEEKNMILESITDGFFALDNHSIITYWNREAELILHKSRHEMIGKNLWEVYADDQGPISFVHSFKSANDNRIKSYEWFNEVLQRWLEFSIYPSDNGPSIYFKDITARKSAELERLQMVEEILQRNKDLEQFSYIVSHNLRAPVANILGLSRELNHDYTEPASVKILSNYLMLSAEQLDGVLFDLNGILQMRREFTEKKESVSLSAITENILCGIADLVSRENIKVIVDFTAADEFWTIKSFIYSIFYNLISNSVKYRREKENPVIEISTRRINDQLIITFKDNGMGIDLVKNKDQIFGLYKRFHRHVDGKGLGLFMVKTQTETLGGKISVRSKVNKGAEFTLKFKVT